MNKKYLIFLFCIGSAICNLWSEPYTLDQLLHIGFRNSKEIKHVKEEMAKTDARIWEAKASAFPEISASANYQYAWKTANPFAMEIDAGSFGAAPVNPATGNPYTIEEMILEGWADDPGFANSASILLAQSLDAITGVMGNLDLEPKKQTVALSLSLQQPIFAQGKVSIGLKIAKKYNETLLCKYDIARQNTKAAITRLFYGALLALKNSRIQKQAFSHAEETHRLTVIRFALGKAGEIDTLASRLGLEKTRMEVREAEGRKRTAYEALIKTTGIVSSVEEFSISGEFPDDGNFTITPDEALQTMRRNSKVLGQLDGMEQVQEQLVRLQKSDYLPMIYCGAALGKMAFFNEWENMSWQDDQKVFAGMTLTLFSGSKRLQKIRVAQADQRLFAITKEQAIDGLEIGIRDAYEKLESNREQLVSARALVALAEKGYSLSCKAYEVGSITLNELKQREIELNSAHMAFNAAQFGFHSAVIELKLLMGTLSTDEKEGL